MIRRLSPDAQPPHATGPLDEGNVLEEAEPTTITHRRGQTKFLVPGEEEPIAVSKMGRAAAKLCRLAFELAKAADVAAMAELALAGLAESTQTDAGALLLFAAPPLHEPRGEDLEIVASRSTSAHRYHRVSNFLASTVLREGEAVLARNVVDDSTLGTRDSQGEILATSVICAPVRRAGQLFGLIHLYSTNRAVVPDPDDLEFTLAVADTVAVALENLRRRQELAENLTRVRSENVELRERLGIFSDIIGAQPRHPPGDRGDRPRRGHQLHRADPRRERRGQGTGRPAPCTTTAPAATTCSSASTAPRCRPISWPASCSATSGAPLPAATERKIGKFEAAHKGTLMLDEIGEMGSGLQAKFLRVLEGHPFERVGGNKPIKVNVRVIAATNRDIERDVTEGLFRRDLYFRLRVLEIVVPALRKRTEDIPLLADYFLQKFNAETGRKIKGFTPAAREQLLKYLWPGNVRELKNVIERAVVLCRDQEIGVEDLLLTKLATPGDTTDVPAPAVAEKFQPLSLDNVERRHIFETLRHTGWNKSKTANILGIERSTLDRKIRRYQLEEASS